jgi:hypothetical protein
MTVTRGSLKHTNSEAEESLGMPIHSFKYVYRLRRIEFHNFVLLTHSSQLIYQSGNTL